LVGLIMGSKSDWETLTAAAETLTALGVAHEAKVVSAHRTPQRLYEYASSAKARGLKVIIAGAGGAAHLPGMAASMTPLPVLGVPIKSRELKGLDSLLSIVQMPKGVPVGTLAIGEAGAVNAALLAAAILALNDDAIAQRLDAFRAEQTASVNESPTCALCRPAARSAFSAAASLAACWPSPQHSWASMWPSSPTSPIAPPPASR
jgi:5-(carboxyamino)imidazole ribonucleotide mutase